jgi:hypothetical protein
MDLPHQPHPQQAIQSIIRLIENIKDMKVTIHAVQTATASLPDSFGRRHHIHSASDDLESGAGLAMTQSKYFSDIKASHHRVGIGPKSQQAIS